MRRLVLLFGLVVATSARAAPGAPSPADGDRLDGREPPQQQVTVRFVPQVLFLLPRVVLAVVMTPTAWVAEQAEKRRLYARLYWAFTADDRQAGLRPELRFESGLGIAGGIRYFNRRALGPGSLIQVRGRTGGPGVFFGDVTAGARGIALRVDGERRDDATFAGTQGETKEELRAEGLAIVRYGFDRVGAELGIARPLPRPLSAELLFGVAHWAFNDGKPKGDDPTIDRVYCSDCAAGIVDEALVPGFNDGTRRVRAEVALALETREHPRYASGVAARLAAGWAHGIAGDPSHDVAAAADVAGTWNMGDRSLGLRLRAGIIEPLGDDPVPFVALLGASGRNGIRALRKGRLRGNSVLVGTASYRYLVTPNIDFILFVDYGGAFGRWFDGFSTDHLIDAYGVGLWLFNAKGRYFEGHLLARVEAAWAPGEGFRVAFATSFD